ncbi:hypothetical protein GF407_00405 [candidate division KSB1 bacterium]|nr:hypothetical protein [candidate division KSB1 bacterium]
MIIKRIRIYGMTILFLLTCFSNIAWTQHRGDNLAFQGLSIPEGNGVKALAMGSAYTSVSGDVNALFHNPAGLGGIDKVQFSFELNSNNKIWRENQIYRPCRQFVNVGFILDGLYVPKPEYNGWYDWEAFLEDTTLAAEEPLLGTDYFSEEAADWQISKNDFDLNNVALAVPFQLANRSIVVSAAYSKKYQVWDYDRNHTHLVPHPGYTYYEGLFERVVDVTDSTRMYWSDYGRERSGKIWNMTFGLAVELNKYLKLGLSMERLSGETDDRQGLSRVGYFDLVTSNEFRFSYDTLATRTTGTSEFSATKFKIGTMIETDHINVGFSLSPGYTLERDWNYTTVTSSPSMESSTVMNAGIDDLKIPLSYAIGLSINPVKPFTISADMRNTRYSEAEFNFAYGDSTHRGWVDQTIYSVGVDYTPWEWLSLLAGYRYLPEVFVPDGAALKDRGPVADSYTFGMSLKLFYGRLNAAYEIRRLKYYDSYLSNTNYVMESLDRILVGYTIML